MCPNLFTLLFLITVATGGVLGTQLGFKQFGYFGATVGGILGTALGLLVGCGFNRLLDGLMVVSVRRKSTNALRAELVDDYIPGTYVSGLIITVLLERGEPVESFRDYIFRQLHSEHVTWRKSGLYNLSICYPGLAAKLEGFDPLQPTPEDLRRLSVIERAPNKACWRQTPRITVAAASVKRRAAERGIWHSPEDASRGQ